MFCCFLLSASWLSLSLSASLPLCLASLSLYHCWCYCCVFTWKQSKNMILIGVKFTLWCMLWFPTAPSQEQRQRERVNKSERKREWEFNIRMEKRKWKKKRKYSGIVDLFRSFGLLELTCHAIFTQPCVHLLHSFSFHAGTLHDAWSKHTHTQMPTQPLCKTFHATSVNMCARSSFEWKFS